VLHELIGVFESLKLGLSIGSLRSELTRLFYPCRWQPDGRQSHNLNGARVQRRSSALYRQKQLRQAGAVAVGEGGSGEKLCNEE
jgi:hypothetical protein